MCVCVCRKTPLMDSVCIGIHGNWNIPVQPHTDQINFGCTCRNTHITDSESDKGTPICDVPLIHTNIPVILQKLELFTSTDEYRLIPTCMHALEKRLTNCMHGYYSLRDKVYVSRTAADHAANACAFATMVINSDIVDSDQIYVMKTL